MSDGVNQYTMGRSSSLSSTGVKLVIGGAMPTNDLESIKNEIKALGERMDKYHLSPTPNFTNRLLYSQILNEYRKIRPLIETKLNCDNNTVDRTPNHMLDKEGRDWLDNYTKEDKTFFIYTIGFNHPNDAARVDAYLKLTTAITGETYSNIQMDRWRNHTFYEWRKHITPYGETEGAWGPGPPWKPENFMMIWEEGIIPENVKKPVNIETLERFKKKRKSPPTWAQAYGSISRFGPFVGRRQKDLRAPEAWRKVFNKNFEICHLRKLGMSYQNPWKREKGYTDLAAMSAGKGDSKAFHSIRAFSVSWKEDVIQKYMPKGSKTGPSSSSTRTSTKTTDKERRKAIETLRRLTGGDIEHDFHREFYYTIRQSEDAQKTTPVRGGQYAALLNKWEEKSIGRFQSKLKAGKTFAQSLEYNTKYEYIFNLPYTEVQKICNYTVDEWFISQAKNNFQTAQKTQDGKLIPLFKYKIEAIHWLQEDANAETQRYQFLPVTGEDSHLESKEFGVFHKANNDLENVRKRRRLEYNDGDNNKKKSPRGNNSSSSRSKKRSSKKRSDALKRGSNKKDGNNNSMLNRNIWNTDRLSNILIKLRF